MGLADDVRALRDRTLAELAAAHDYYTHTRTVWNLFGSFIPPQGPFQIHNEMTGTIASRDELIALSKRYVDKQLAEATFLQFLTIFESFYGDLVGLWLTAYPQSMGRRTVDFRTILDQPDKDALIRLVVRRELNDVLYDRPTAWFAYLEERANLGVPSADAVGRIAEAKAARDVMLHNRGISNAAYRMKAGDWARTPVGEEVDVAEPYHGTVYRLMLAVVGDLGGSLAAKVA